MTVFLHSTDENQCIFDAWTDNELVDGEVKVPSDVSQARFNLEAVFTTARMIRSSSLPA